MESRKVVLMILPTGQQRRHRHKEQTFGLSGRRGWDVLRENSIETYTFSWVAQSRPTLRDPMDCSTPGLPVHHQFLEFTQLDVHWVSATISSSVIPFSFCLQSFPASGSFQRSQLFASGGQSIGISASTSVLPMNIQDWFPLGLMDWYPCILRDSQESSLTPEFKIINSLAPNFLYNPTLTSIHDSWKNHSFDYTDLCQICR